MPSSRSAIAVGFLVLLLAFLFAGQAAALTLDSVITNGLFEPYAVAADTTNIFYLADSANSRIAKYIPNSGVLTNFAGLIGHPGTNDGVNYFARFSNPRGIIQARDGLVVADTANHLIRFISFSGAVSRLAGVPASPGLADGPGADALFNFPIGLAADAAGNIYIADSKNGAIRLLDTAHFVITVADGFNEPAGVAVSADGRRIFVADTANHAIRLIETDGSNVIGVRLIAGSDSRVSGVTDSIFATEALFNKPTGLLWLGDVLGLLVCDTGNHTVRRVYQNPDLAGIPGAEYSVETFAGTPAQPGFANGPATAAKFNSPGGLARDFNGGYLVADIGNHALRRIQVSTPAPPVSDPVIGWVDFVKDAFGERVTILRRVTQAIFNNDVTIAVLAEAGTETYFTFGPTPANEDPIPIPSPATGNSPPSYSDGLPESQVPPSMISAQPDVTIKVRSIADGRTPSAVVQARFKFQTANPVILGNNPASFTLQNRTAGAQMWYTSDGSHPVETPGPNNFGPKFDGDIITLPVGTSPILFKVRAFRDNYRPSTTQQITFDPADVVYNRISFGFEGGEASSAFVGAVGQTFYAPVTLTLLPKQRIYSLQFNVAVTNVEPFTPPVAPGAVGFQSMLQRLVPDTTPPAFEIMPPSMFVFDPNTFMIHRTNLLLTNASLNLVMVGWLERLGFAYLYDTTKQDLLTYSQAHDNQFLGQNGKVIVGSYSFVIPTTASVDLGYQVQIGRPSATSDGVGADVFIDTPTNGSPGVGHINSIKIVTVGTPEYVVGDVAPFRWFNAGDFGDTNLLNNDVLQVFQSAAYRVNVPPTNSDLFDAMDSSNGSGSMSDGNELSIDAITQGDGALEVDDVYVTFRRSLDPSRKWFARYRDANGVLRAREVPNRFRGQANRPAENFSATQTDVPAVTPALLNSTDPPAVRFFAPDLQVIPGQTVSAPIRAQIAGKYPLRVFMLNLNVKPLDGSPALTQPARFIPAPGLGPPTFTAARGSANYAAAWLNNSVPGLWGANSVGTLELTVPTNAPANAAYKIEFEHLSASPTGLGLFPREIQDGLLTLSNRLASSWHDGIPDAWRLRFFGSVSNLLSHALADADGDGVSNGAEFNAGTNPTDLRSVLRLLMSLQPANGGLQVPAGIVLRWPTATNKTYAIEWALSPSGPDWTPLSTQIIGTGWMNEFTDTTAGNQSRFYRVRLAQ